MIRLYFIAILLSIPLLHAHQKTTRDQTHALLVVGQDSHETMINSANAFAASIQKNLHIDPTHIHQLRYTKILGGTAKDKLEFKTKVLKTLEEISMRPKEEEWIIYFAGHGLESYDGTDSSFYIDATLLTLQCYLIEGAAHCLNLKTYGQIGDVNEMTGREIHQKLKNAQPNISLIFESCHSGQFAQNITLPNGLIFTSSQFNESSWIVEKNGQKIGIFTWALTQALQHSPHCEAVVKSAGVFECFFPYVNTIVNKHQRPVLFTF